MPQLRILETSLYTTDLRAARNFYHDFLGLEIITEDLDRHIFFRCAQSVLLLFNPHATSQPGQDPLPLHGGVGPGHTAFAVSPVELATWRARLMERNIAILHEHRWPNGAQSIYFPDPAGNILEFATPSLWSISFKD